MNYLLEGLTFVREKLDNPRAWLQHEYAIDMDGRPVEILGPFEDAKMDCLYLTSPKAWCDNESNLCAFCLMGAIRLYSAKFEKSWHMKTGMIATHLRAYTPQGMRLDDFNDAPETTHIEVLRLLDRAISDLSSGAGRSNAEIEN